MPDEKFTDVTSFQKLANRRKALERYNPSKWSSQRKQRVTEILDQGLEYISSEESGDESVDESVVLYTRPLPWLKSKYRNSLHLLDKIHFNSLSRKSKGMVRQRKIGEPSQRSLPAKPLDFCIVNDENIENIPLDSSISGSENIDY